MGISVPRRTKSFMEQALIVTAGGMRPRRRNIYGMRHQRHGGSIEIAPSRDRSGNQVNVICV